MTAHTEMVLLMVRLLGVKTYLELGVADGTTFVEVENCVDRCIGVDVDDRRARKVGDFYCTDTDVFFKEFKDKVDLVFIDAAHTFENVKRDFENSLKLLNVYGAIIMHDTDPPSAHWASPNWCGDVYKIVDYIYEKHPELDIITLPEQEEVGGMSIVRRKKDRRTNIWKEKGEDG